MPVSFRQSLNAILLACFGWFLFCVCDAMSKWLVREMSAVQILAVSGVFGSIVTTAWIARFHGRAGFFTPKWRWYVVRSLSQVTSSFFAITALSTIPLSDFYGIIFLTPMVTALMAALFLNERIGTWRIGAIAFGFMGVLVIAGPSFASHNVGYLYALGSVFCATLSAICIRRIGREDVTARFVFYPFVISLFVYIPAAFLHGWTTPPTALDAALLFAFGPAALIGILAYSAAFSRAREIAVVAPFHYTQIIWGSLFGYIFFNHVPALTTFIGAVIIVKAGIVIIWREHLHHVQIATTAVETPI
jgi:S-adenosylmethionine uptake transporter